MDQVLTPAFIAALTGLITAIATLVTVLNTHSTVRRIDTSTNGTLSRMQDQLEHANTQSVKLAAAAPPEAVRAIAPELSPAPPEIH